MATYKVLQDIEAEDKLVGPLSLRQFIYAIIMVMILFVAWQLARVQALLALPLILPAAFFGLLAAPLGAYQSSEIWLLAKIRFFLKPRRRIWDQTGLKELVTITAPKRVEHNLTNNLSQTEVKSRLQALANTIDSRGWAVKNVNVNLSAQPGYLSDGSSDRLLDVSALPHEVVASDVTATDDIMDAKNNPTAQHLDAMITASEQAHRKEVVQQMHQGSEASGKGQSSTTPDYWFMNQGHGGPVVSPASQPTADPTTATATGLSTADEQALLENIHYKQEHKPKAYGHMRTLQPIGKGGKSGAGTAQLASNPDIMGLATNDDLNVATIARQANKKSTKSSGDSDDGEVVVSLR